MNHGNLVASGPIDQVLNNKNGVVYSVILKGASDGLGKRLSELPWVTSTSVADHNGTSAWQVSVNNEEAAEKELLRYVLADHTVTVAEFSSKKYELEEVFMEIVKGDGNVR